MEDSMVFQYEVYEYARGLIVNHKLTSVLDIGCGLGMKLKALILPVCQNITGVDEPGTIARCKDLHDFGTWLAHDIEDSVLNLGQTFDLIIAADVIEHLVDPDKLLDLIKRHSTKETFIVLSTPERDASRGKQHMGPPPNVGHVREWSFSEFRKYVESRGFKVLKHFRAATLTPLQFQHPTLITRLLRSIKRFIGSLIGRTKLQTQVLLLKYDIKVDANGQYQDYFLYDSDRSRYRHRGLRR